MWHVTSIWTLNPVMQHVPETALCHVMWPVMWLILWCVTDVTWGPSKVRRDSSEQSLIGLQCLTRAWCWSWPLGEVRWARIGHPLTLGGIWCLWNQIIPWKDGDSDGIFMMITSVSCYTDLDGGRLDLDADICVIQLDGSIFLWMR